jgi:putative transposase
VGIIDSQSVKNTQKTEAKGYDAGKKIKGIKRHIVTDTNGLILGINIHSASNQDRDGAKELLLKTKDLYPSIIRYFADSAYSGSLQLWCYLKVKVLLSIIKRDTKKFKILPIRWIVERTFGWMNNFRRLSKHYEHTCISAKTQIEIAMIKIMLKRLGNLKC